MSDVLATTSLFVDIAEKKETCITWSSWMWIWGCLGECFLFYRWVAHFKRNLNVRGWLDIWLRKKTADYWHHLSFHVCILVSIEGCLYFLSILTEGTKLLLNSSMPLRNKNNTYDKEQGICDCHNEVSFHKSAGIHVFISSSNHIAHIMKLQITLLPKFSYTCTHINMYPYTYTDRHTCTHVSVS